MGEGGGTFEVGRFVFLFGVGVRFEAFGFGEEARDLGGFKGGPWGRVALALEEEEEDIAFLIEEEGAGVGVRVVLEEGEGVEVGEAGCDNLLREGGGAHVVTGLVEDVGSLGEGPEGISGDVGGDGGFRRWRWRGEVEREGGGVGRGVGWDEGWRGVEEG